MTHPLANYALHVALSLALTAAFIQVYSRVTPYDEFLLIRQGNCAAALSFGGALLGFALTLASCIFHASDLPQFLYWAASGLALQLLAYGVTTRCLGMSREHIENNNVAFGTLLACIAVSIGAINAACIS
jgi:putative membrane protein